MRKFYSTLAVLAAAVLALPGAAHAQANKLTVGMPTTPPNVVHMPVLIAKDLGLYKKYGVDVETVALEDGVKVFRAMLAGSLDVAQAPGATTIVAISKGSPVKTILATLYKFEASMVVHDNIKTMADLKGKRIGIQQPGGFADILSKAILRNAKIDPKDVNFVSIASEDVPALVADQVDTAILHVEQEMLAKEKVPSLHAIARMWEVQPKQVYTVYSVREDTLKNKAAALAGLRYRDHRGDPHPLHRQGQGAADHRQGNRLSGKDHLADLRLPGEELHLGRQYRPVAGAYQLHRQPDDQGRQYRQGQDADLRPDRRQELRGKIDQAARRMEGTRLPDRGVLRLRVARIGQGGRCR